MQNVNKMPVKLEDGIDTFLGLFRLMHYEDDIRLLEKYQAGEKRILSKERLAEVKVLDTLTELGFSTKDIGTFFYRDMILKAMHYLEEGKDDYGNAICRETLLEEMQKPFSQFYLDIARHDLDVGIKTFHTCIEKALESVDYRKAEPILLYDIYGDSTRDTNYGEHALLIAGYVNRSLGIGQTKPKQARLIKFADYLERNKAIV